MAATTIVMFGATYVPNKTYGNFNAYTRPAYRTGTFLTHALFNGGGVALGRNLVTNRLNATDIEDPADFNQFLQAHETGHWVQQIKMGFAKFYSQTMRDYLKHGQYNAYSTKGALEYDANQYSLQRIGYYYNIWGERQTH